MTRTAYRLIVFALVATVLVAGGLAFYFYRSASLEKSAASDTDDMNRVSEARDIVAAVGELMVLPQGEEPTVATVSNLEQLTGQPFFANAKVGHKVLIYVNARKAILYDPTISKIVEVTSLNIDTTGGGIQNSP